VHTLRRKLVLGAPNESARFGEAEIRTHDELGLPLDPLNYAKPACRLCNGKGTFTRVRPLDETQMKTLVSESKEAAERVRMEGNVARSMAGCACVMPRYQQARRDREEDMRKCIFAVFENGTWKQSEKPVLPEREQTRPFRVHVPLTGLLPRVK
jgi:hypothetical protein